MQIDNLSLSLSEALLALVESMAKKNRSRFPIAVLLTKNLPDHCM